VALAISAVISARVSAAGCRIEFMSTNRRLARVATTAFAALVFVASNAGAQAPQQPVPAAGQTLPAPAAGAQARPGAPTTASATAARTFTSPVGLLFNTVRADKALDFERLVAAVRGALEASTDPTMQAQARGWRFFKAAEPGPNNSVLYVFVLDPTVPGEDYGLGRVLAQAYTDPVALQDVWKLYTGSVTGGGSLLNLSPVPVPAAPAAAGTAPADATAPAAPAPAK
jgi:hypothetical protein